MNPKMVDPYELQLKSTDFLTIKKVFMEWLWDKNSKYDPEVVADDFMELLVERTKRMGTRLSELPF